MKDRNKKASKSVVGLLRFLVPVGLVVWVVARFDVGGALARLAGVHLGVFAMAAILSWAAVGIRALRWLLVSRLLEIGASTRSVIRSYALGFASGAVVGDTVGTAGRLIELHGPDVDLRRAGHGVALDYGYDVASLLILFIPATFILPSGIVGQDPLPTVVLVVLILGIASVPFMLWWASAAGRALSWFTSKTVSSDGTSHTLKSLTPWEHCSIYAVSIAARLVQSVYVWALAHALGVGLSFGFAAAAVIMSSVVVLVPISFSGIGTREAAMVLLFEWAGQDAEAGLSLAILMSLVLVLSRLLAGMMWAGAWRGSTRQLRVPRGQ